MSAALLSVFQRFRSDGNPLSDVSLTVEPKRSGIEKWIKVTKKLYNKFLESTLFNHHKTEEWKPKPIVYKFQDKTYLLTPTKKFPFFEYLITEDCLTPDPSATKTKATTVFKKNYFGGKRWTKGHPYTVEEKTLYLTPTNFPRVSYLDLEEFSVNVANFCPEIPKVSDLYTLRHIQNHPFVECSVALLKIYRQPVDELVDKISTIYFNDVKMMIVEMIKGIWVELWNDWDQEKFVKFMMYNLTYKSENFMSISSSLISLLRRHKSSIDSGFIANCFKMLSYCREPRRYFLTRMPKSYVETFLEHSMNFACGERSPMFGGHEGWVLEENLVEHAFLKGNLKRLQMLLRYRCPSVFVPSCLLVYFDEEETRDIFWPREKPVDGGEPIASYYSTEYIALVLLFLFRFFPVAKTRKANLTWGVRLIWRSIPTPFIPKKDIQDFIALQKLERRERETWKTNLEILPKDFATEYSPRSLMHLSRCSIRQTCSSPDDINCLPLPSEIKFYLKLNK